MIDRHFIHTATIVRPTHTITGAKKGTGEDTIATGVRCRFEPAGDSESASVLGMSAIEAWRGFFPTGTDIENRDKITWQDPTVPIPMVVEGILPYYARDGSFPHHLEVALKSAKGMQ